MFSLKKELSLTNLQATLQVLLLMIIVIPKRSKRTFVIKFKNFKIYILCKKNYCYGSLIKLLDTCTKQNFSIINIHVHVSV